MSDVWWHLHTGRPEQCIDGGREREPLARRAAAMPLAVVVDSMLAPGECAAKIAWRRADPEGYVKELA